MSKEEIGIPEEVLMQKIYLVNGIKVMLDSDLAELYQVETKRLNEQVKRNSGRFPEDFMFQINDEEFENLRSHFATSSEKHGGRRYLPYAFTEQGIAMLSGVLRSEKAVQVNIAIMRAFVQMREAMLSNKDMARKIDEMESKYDGQFQIIFDALRSIFEAPVPDKPQIGYIKHQEQA